MKKQFFIGLDVHKKTTAYAVRDWNGALALEGECASVFKDLWIILEPYTTCCRVALEASSHFYHLYEGFKSKNTEISVANVIQLRRLIGKNDRLDAKRLSDMLRLNTMPESFIPGKLIQYIRSLTLLRYNAVKEQTRLKNQIHALIDWAGVRFPVRSAFCKKWCCHLEAYIKHTGSFELQYLYEAEQDVEKRITKLDNEIMKYTKEHFEETSKLLMSIPGIGPIWSAFVIAQVLPVSRFANKRKLRRYAGVVPVKDKSAKKCKREYLPKGSSRKMLRFALVQAAHSAVKAEGRLKEYFDKKRKEKDSPGMAIMCVASSLSDILYMVLSTGKPYQA